MNALQNSKAQIHKKRRERGIIRRKKREENESTKKAILGNQCFCINHNMLYPVGEDYAIRQGFSISVKKVICCQSGGR